jgi:integrase
MAKFTDTFISRLKPKDKRDEKFEGGGFGILIYPAGTKTWIYRYKIENKKDNIILGHYPEMSLFDARKAFVELCGLRRQGKNPKLLMQQQAEKEVQTVKKLALSWYSSYIEKNRKQPQQIKQLIDADIIPLLGHMELEKIQTRDITKALDVIVHRGAPVHANKVLSTLKQALNYATSRGELLVNPAANIRARDIGGLEKPRERFLTLEEIKLLWFFLDSDSSKMSIHIRLGIKIILLTGVRTAELRLAQWNEFDLKQSVWTIPASHTKSGMMMKVHLSSQAKALLKELKNHSASCYVIPGSKDDQPLTDKALPRAVNRIQERVGIPQWTAHDLRRTFATQLGEALHIDPVVIEKCLGHKMPKIMATYNKNEMLLQRKEALDQWAQCVERLIQGKQ